MTVVIAIGHEFMSQHVFCELCFGAGGTFRGQTLSLAADILVFLTIP